MSTRKKISILLSILWLTAMTVSCTTLVQKAENVAQNSNNPEISRFLEYYRNHADKGKFKAACYLVANMPDKYSITSEGERLYDIDIVNADSLAFSLEQSFIIWKNSPYSSLYDFDDFCEYILPYRIANEPLTYYWKKDCPRCLSVKIDEDNIAETAKKINASIHIGILPANVMSYPESYTEMKNTGYGKCEDRAVLLAMHLRSHGIPAAYEFVPYWGSNNNGHAFVSVITPNGGVIPLANTDESGRKIYLSRKTPKIYRKIYSTNARPSIYKSKVSNLPSLFQDKDIKDVTSLHKIGQTDIQGVNDASYLAVFSPAGWTPVAYGKRGRFRNIGTGVNADGKQEDEAIDLGDGIMYLPVVLEDALIVPKSEPLIVSQYGYRYLQADTLIREKVIITRKYPLNNRIIGFAKSMTGGIFEGANKPDFSDAELLYEISDIPESRMQKISINPIKPYRYIRYRRPIGIFSIAEMKVFGTDGQEITFNPIACSPIENVPEKMEKIYDSDPLTYFEVAGGIELWVGADLGKPVHVSEIGFAPRNDDNAVSPGDVYELLYWSNEWKSAGIKQAEDYCITYSDIPRNALLWLRNLTRGEEERPFTYESGRQIWW